MGHELLHQFAHHRFWAGGDLRFHQLSHFLLPEHFAGSVRKMLAASSGGIYDASGGGSAGVPLKSGFASDVWQTVNFLGHTLFCNGVDPVQLAILAKLVEIESMPSQTAVAIADYLLQQDLEVIVLTETRANFGTAAL